MKIFPYSFHLRYFCQIALTKNSAFRLLVGIVFFVEFQSCQRTPIARLSSFIPYISGYSSGVISKTSFIKVELNQEFTTGASLKTPLDEKIIENDENIKGDTYWLNSKTLIFKPHQYLSSGKTFHFRFNLGKILKVPDSLKTFHFTVHTLLPNIEFEDEGLKSYHSQKSRMIYEGTFTTADLEDPSKVEEIISLSFPGKSPKIHWTHSQENRKHHFTMDSLIREDKPVSFSLHWNAKSLGIKASGDASILLPGINEFKVLHSRALQDSDQSILVQFSDPISKMQDLRGLFTFGQMNDLRYSVEGSEVKIFFGSLIEGSFQLTAHTGIKNINEKRLINEYSSNLTFENQSPKVSFPGKGVILPSTGKLLVPFESINLKKVDVNIIKIYTRNIPQFLQEQSLSGDATAYEFRRVGRPIIQKTIQLAEDVSLNLHHKNRFFLDLDKMIKTEPGAIYRIILSFKKSYAINLCPGDSSKTATGEMGSDNENPSYEGELDYGNTSQAGNPDGENKFWNFFTSGYQEGGEYDWRNRDNPCSNAYYTTGRWASRNILASNIGLLAKKQDHDKVWISVNDILSTESLSGVQLELLDFQQQVISSGVSDGEGICVLNPIRKPYLLIAKRGEERGYLKLNDENALSQSKFDVGGEIIQNGIKGFIYQEREVHRPGDSLYISFILEDSENKLPELYPVNFELRNPSGQIVKKNTLTESVDKFYVFKTKTEVEDPTGVWSVSVKVGGNTFNQDVRVETIMPNRLKINLDFGGAKQLSALNHPSANLNATWLFGGIASKLKAKVDMKLYADGATSFPNFKDFIFDDPTSPFEGDTKTVFDQSLDENGNAKIPLSINMGVHPPGKLKAQFLTKVFEPGGAFSIHQTSIPFVFYSSFVGLKVPKGDEAAGGILMTHQANLLEIVQVDEDGNLLKQETSVELSLYKLGWHWWWENSNNHETDFLQAKTTQLISTQTLNLSKGKTKWNLQVEEPNWGRYLVLIKDLKSGHVSGKIVYIESPDWRSRAVEANPTEASMLSLDIDKSKYSVGETVHLKIPSTLGGKALVSIETGTKTLKTYWVATKAGQTNFSFITSRDMAPNVYINVTLLQGKSSLANDLPIRMYGIIPLFVENKETILKPIIQVEKSLRPESYANVTISESSGKEMTYTLALVDEGLLDLTGFQTPDPHETFYAREALGVKTFDIYDDVLGILDGTSQRILSIGGDEADKAKSRAKKDPVNQVNRFKPVVLFLGPFHIHPREQKIHRLLIPQYIGALRVMVIAGHDKAFGNAETSVKIKKPLMLLATLPRVLAPREELNLPVTVFGMEPSIKNAQVSISSSEYFDITSPNTQTVNFPKPGDQLINFGLKLKGKTGVAKVTVTAKSGQEISSYTIQLAVRNPNSYITKDYPMELVGSLPNNKSATLTFSSIGNADMASGYLEVSTLPSLNLQKRLGYLLDYPNGCAEQITSAAFPQLYLGQLGDLTPKEKASTEFNIKSALQKLSNFQASGGGINYWPGLSEPDEWVSSYTGHFMIEAQKKGYLLPQGYLSSLLRYEKNTALTWTPRKENFYGGDEIQAYRLFILALAHLPELGAMNRLVEFKYLSDPAKWRLASAYALTGNKEIAHRLIQKLSLESKPYRYGYYTYGSNVRDQAVKLETLTLLGDREKAGELLHSVANSLSSDSWFSTQETAYSLIAIAMYCGSKPSADRIHYRYAINGSEKEVTSSSYISTVHLPYQPNLSNFKIENLNENHLYARIIEKGKPETGMVPEPQNDSKELKMEVTYSTLQGDKIDPTSLRQGTDFIANVRLINTGKNGVYYNMVLSEIFPSGWEILNSRLINQQNTNESNKVFTIPTYQDIRDDRVLTYFNLSPSVEANFSIYLNASYAGHFYAPGIYCEAMYDASLHAGNAGKWVDVLSSSKK